MGFGHVSGAHHSQFPENGEEEMKSTERDRERERESILRIFFNKSGFRPHCLAIVFSLALSLSLYVYTFINFFLSLSTESQSQAVERKKIRCSEWRANPSMCKVGKAFLSHFLSISSLFAFRLPVFSPFSSF